MTITLTPIVPSGQTATPCVLCAGDARNSGATPNPMGPQNVRRAEKPGAALREYVGADRVNGEWVKCDSGVLSFGVVRIFDTPAHAAAFALTGFGAEPREGTLTATVGNTTVTIFSKCVITSRESAQVGVAVATQYTIEG
jgi:hypothetical protein